MSLTISEWTEELARLAEEKKDVEDGFMTASEIKESLNLSQYSWREMIRDLTKAGSIEFRKITRINGFGTATKVPAYRIKPTKKARKK